MTPRILIPSLTLALLTGSQAGRSEVVPTGFRKWLWRSTDAEGPEQMLFRDKENTNERSRGRVAFH